MPTTPRYKKLRNLLHDKIVSGKYVVGDRFHSQNELIKKYNLSFSTVSRALDELVREGLLSRETGKGTFIKSICPGKEASDGETLNIYVFVPVDRTGPGLIDPTKLFQFFEASRPDNYSIRMLPHSSGPDDLDFFLFNRDPIHVAVFLDPLENQQAFREMLGKTCPILLVGLSKPSGIISSLMIDYASATADAVAYLIAMGNKQIAMVCGEKDSIATAGCLVSYKSAYSAASRDFNSSMILYADSNNLEQDLTRLFHGSEQRPSALLVMDSLYVPAALSTARLAESETSQNVSLVCLDSTNFTSTMSPSLSSIFVSPEGIAEKILEMIPRLAAGEILHEVFKCRFIARDSTNAHLPRLSRVK